MSSYQALAVIPARGGSQRIPKKNIRAFMSKPIISYPLNHALAANCFDEIMVSTDSDEIAEVAQKYGASVPFLRSVKNSDDLSNTIDVLLEVLREYKERGKVFDQVCCLYPTAVFIQASHLQQAFSMLQDPGTDEVATFVPYEHPIERAFIFHESTQSMVFRTPEFSQVRTQDLPTSYHDAGQFYCMKTAAFLKDPTMFLSHTKPIILQPSEVQDIDTIDDWQSAEIKYSRLSEGVTKS